MDVFNGGYYNRLLKAPNCVALLVVKPTPLGCSRVKRTGRAIVIVECIHLIVVVILGKSACGSDTWLELRDIRLRGATQHICCLLG